MTKIDRLLIGALVLGVWALVAMQFFGGMTASAAQSTYVSGEVAVTNWPAYQYVLVTNEVEVYCTNCN